MCKAKLAVVFTGLAAFVAAMFATPVMAGPFTGKNEICVGRLSAGNLDTQRGAFVLTINANSQITRFQVWLGYDAMKDPLTAITSGNSFRELLSAPFTLMGGTAKVTFPASQSIWTFERGSNIMEIVTRMGGGKGDTACGSSIKVAMEELADLLKKK